VENLSQRGQERWSKVHIRNLLPNRLLKPQPEKLRGSRFNTPEDLDAFSQKFDEGVKRVFSSDQAAQHVKFGSLRDSDPDCGIRAGRLALTGYLKLAPFASLHSNFDASRTQVSEFFEPSIQSTVDSIRDNFSQRLVTNSVRTL